MPTQALGWLIGCQYYRESRALGLKVEDLTDCVPADLGKMKTFFKELGLDHIVDSLDPTIKQMDTHLTDLANNFRENPL